MTVTDVYSIIAMFTAVANLFVLSEWLILALRKEDKQ